MSPHNSGGGRPRSVRSRLSTRKHETLALVVQRTAYGESDWIVSLFTEKLGKVSALAKHARKSKRRFGGGLEPLHTLKVDLEEPAHRDLLRISSAQLEQPRAPLLHWLGGMEAAGQLLIWVRHAAIPHSQDLPLWRLTQDSLNCFTEAALQPFSERRGAQLILAEAGLYLLSLCGWRLELNLCVRSGVPCPKGRSAMIDPVAGGLVSQACGGASLTATGPQRQRLIAAQDGQRRSLLHGDEGLALALVHQCLRAHAGID